MGSVMIFDAVEFRQNLLNGSVPYSVMEACLDPSEKELRIYQEATHFPLVVLSKDRVGLFSRPDQHCLVSRMSAGSESSSFNMKIFSYTYVLKCQSGYFFASQDASQEQTCFLQLLNVNQYKLFELRTYHPAWLANVCGNPLSNQDARDKLSRLVYEGKRFRLVAELEGDACISLEIYMIYVFDNTIELVFPPVLTIPQEINELGFLEDIADSSFFDPLSFQSIQRNRMPMRSMGIKSLKGRKIGISLDLKESKLFFNSQGEGCSFVESWDVLSMQIYSY